MQQGDLAMALTELAAAVGERNRADPLLCHSDKGLGLEKTRLCSCERDRIIVTRKALYSPSRQQHDIHARQVAAWPKYHKLIYTGLPGFDHFQPYAHI
jgi:hypothetical protein